MKNKKDLLFKKNQCKEVLEKYLAEIEKLSLQKITSNDLISLEKTEELRVKSLIYDSKNYPVLKDTFLFKQKEKLKQVLDKLYNLYSGKILIFTDYSEYCGCIELKSLKYFNAYFDFKDEHSGIISIISKDLKNNLLLDFYEEESEFYLDIEVQGKNWVF
jgi:DNA-directed RNA polymerase beta' subunit